MSDTEKISNDTAATAATAASTAQAVQPLNQKSMEILATVLQFASADISKEVDWKAVTEKLHYANVETAKKRYQQVRKQLMDSTGTVFQTASRKKRSAKTEKQENGNDDEENIKKENGGLRGGDAVGNPKRRGRKPKNATANGGEEKSAKGKKTAKRVKIEKEEGKMDGGEEAAREDDDMKVEQENGGEEVDKENATQDEE
ncbi:hypothetical protein ABW21_db0202712 [Orbilia brochopaga]|nr:hypothetical protein ABW21_db0202712 [Drechslerella brochopaga]